MEQNKLEKEFKKKLNQRDINPSENSWDKLDAMLTVAEKEQSKRINSWIFIAASFVGFLLVGTVYFNQKEIADVNQMDEIVNKHSKIVKSNSESLTILKSLTKNDKNDAIVNVPKVNSKDNRSAILKKDSVTNIFSPNQNQLTEVSIINQEIELESIPEPTKALTVDELLASVNQSRRVSNKSNPNLEVKVNPNMLFQQMNSDLEPTYRQGVLSKVAAKLKVVKDAVVNRN